MHFLWNFFLERRSFTILVMVSLLAAGALSIVAIPKEAAPEVVIPMGIVTTALPGATAADVETLVTDKLEPSIRNVANIDKVTSTSRQGVSVITAQFLASADIETAIQDLRNAVEQARGDLPSDAQVPTVTKVDFENQPVLMIGISSELAPETLKQLGDDLKNDLLGLEGVSRVEATGVRAREVSVIVNQGTLASYGLSAGSVVSALQSANTSVPAGTLTVDGVHYPVQFNGAIDNVADIAGAPIRTPTGQLRVGDVAAVIDGFAPAGAISRLAESGQEPAYALTLNIYKSSGSNILSVSRAVGDRLEELDDTLLLGSQHVIVYDAGDEVRHSIMDLLEAGRDTIILVLLVLFLTVGFREAVVSALAIPFSFTIAFIGMWATGNTINFISLFALIIAIGILVDAAIVMVEAIHSNREKGLSETEAARAAIRQFSWPLIAGTTATIAVFVPLFFLSGIIGQFIRSIPFTITVVLLASIVVALGFVPLMALWLLPRHEDRKSRLTLWRERGWERATAWYRRNLRRLFDSPAAQRIFFAFLAVSFIVAAALPITGLLQTSMFPPADQDFFYIEIELPQASVLATTDAVAREVEKVIAREPEVASYLTSVGSGSVFSGSGSSGSKVANITVNLKTDREQSSIAIAGRVRAELADLQGLHGAKITVVEEAGGPPSGAPIVVKAWSDDATSLAAATEMVENVIAGIAGTRDITSSLANDGTELSISVDRAKAAEYGLSTFDVASALRTAITGVEATKVRIDGEDVAVRVTTNLNPDYIQPEDTSVADAAALARLPIDTPRGTIPLGTLITVTAGRTSAAIEHEDGERIGTVSAYVESGVNAVNVTNEVRAKIDGADMPKGVRFTYGGDDEEIAKTFSEMLVALVAGVVLMFAILVLEFNAFRTTLRLLLAIPLSLTGVLIGLFIMGQSLSFTAFLGVIALGGVIINHGILLLDVLNNLRRQDAARDPKEVVLDASVSRLRPILMTTVTAVIGMIPLIFVSAMWAPLAYTIAFGLIYGTILTLVLIPLLSYRRLRKEAAGA